MTIKSRQNYGAALRAIVWGVVFVFTLTSVTWTMPTAHANTTPSVRPGPVVPLKDLADVSLPAEIGKIRETYRGTSDKTVILIQDAHSIPDAQRSIQSAIDHFQKEYGVTLIGLEGASERLDPQIFRSFPDKELLRKTFDDYSGKGELTGGTAAALFNSSQTAVYQGIEDWELYEKGIAGFLGAMKTESEVTASLEQRIIDLEREKGTSYPKDLLEVDRLLTQFGENKTNLAQVLSGLSPYLPPPESSELAVLLKEIQTSQRPETGDLRFENEIKKIAAQVESVLKSRSSSPELKQDLQAFYEKRQEYQTSQMTSQAFALFLRDLAKQHKVRVKVSRELASLVEDQKKLRDIEGTHLFEGFKRYADAVKEKLIGKSEPAVQDLIKQLNIRTQELALLKRLAKLELSFEDWTILKKTMVKPWTLDPELRTKLESHLRFYRIAEQRDEVFYNNLTDLMKRNESRGMNSEPRAANAAILVAGGFHTGGLTQAFKEKGISYILVMPRIDRLPEQSLYREHMQGDVSWKNYFEVKNGKVNLYDAFVRATRDKLLNTKSLTGPESRIPSPVCKQWRDQIIRDLAEQGRIAEASAYTRFMDELGGPGATNDTQRLKETWLANIDRFGNGLKKLQAAGKLSASGIAQLLKSFTTAEPVLANVLAPGTEIQWPLSAQRSETREADSFKAFWTAENFLKQEPLIWERFKEMGLKNEPVIVNLEVDRPEMVWRSIRDKIEALDDDQLVALSLVVHDPQKDWTHYVMIVDSVGNIASGALPLGLLSLLPFGDQEFILYVIQDNKNTNIHFRNIIFGRRGVGDINPLRGKKIMKPVFERLEGFLRKSFEGWTVSSYSVTRSTRRFMDRFNAVQPPNNIFMDYRARDYEPLMLPTDVVVGPDARMDFVVGRIESTPPATPEVNAAGRSEMREKAATEYAKLFLRWQDQEAFVDLVVRGELDKAAALIQEAQKAGRTHYADFQLKPQRAVYPGGLDLRILELFPDLEVVHFINLQPFRVDHKVNKLTYKDPEGHSFKGRPALQKMLDRYLWMASVKPYISDETQRGILYPTAERASSRDPQIGVEPFMRADLERIGASNIQVNPVADEHPGIKVFEIRFSDILGRIRTIYYHEMDFFGKAYAQVLQDDLKDKKIGLLFVKGFNPGREAAERGYPRVFFDGLTPDGLLARDHPSLSHLKGLEVGTDVALLSDARTKVYFELIGSLGGIGSVWGDIGHSDNTGIPPGMDVFQLSADPLFAQRLFDDAREMVRRNDSLSLASAMAIVRRQMTDAAIKAEDAARGSRSEMRPLPELNNKILLDEATGRIAFGDEPVVRLDLELWGVRHGITPANEVNERLLPSERDKKGNFQGQVDEGIGEPEGFNQLTPKGKEQAETAADALVAQFKDKIEAGEEIVVVMSPRNRAVETAKAFIRKFTAAGGKVKIVTNREIRAGADEMDFGFCDNKATNDITIPASREFVHRYRDGLDVTAHPGPLMEGTRVLKKGERYLDLLVREKKFAERLNSMFRGRTVVVFGHGTQLGALRVILREKKLTDESGRINWRRSRLPNAAPVLLSKPLSQGRSEVREPLMRRHWVQLALGLVAAPAATIGEALAQPGSSLFSKASSFFSSFAAQRSESREEKPVVGSLGEKELQDKIAEIGTYNVPGRYAPIIRWIKGESNLYLPESELTEETAIVDLGTSTGYGALDLHEAFPAPYIYAVDPKEGGVALELHPSDKIITKRKIDHRLQGIDFVNKEGKLLKVKVIILFNVMQFYSPDEVADIVKQSAQKLDEGGLYILGVRYPVGRIKSFSVLKFMILQKVNGAMVPRELILRQFTDNKGMGLADWARFMSDDSARVFGPRLAKIDRKINTVRTAMFPPGTANILFQENAPPIEHKIFQAQQKTLLEEGVQFRPFNFPNDLSSNGSQNESIPIAISFDQPALRGSSPQFPSRSEMRIGDTPRPVAMDPFQDIQFRMGAKVEIEFRGTGLARSFTLERDRSGNLVVSSTQDEEMLLRLLDMKPVVVKKNPSNGIYLLTSDESFGPEGLLFYLAKNSNGSVSLVNMGEGKLTLSGDFTPEAEEQRSEVREDQEGPRLIKPELKVYDHHDQAYYQIKDAVDAKRIPSGLPLILFDHHSDNGAKEEKIGIENWVTYLKDERVIGDAFWVYPDEEIHPHFGAYEISHQRTFKMKGYNLESIVRKNAAALQAGVVLSFDLDYFAANYAHGGPLYHPPTGEIARKIAAVFMILRRNHIPVYLINGSYSVPHYAPANYKGEFHQALSHAAENYEMPSVRSEVRDERKMIAGAEEEMKTIDRSVSTAYRNTYGKAFRNYFEDLGPQAEFLFADAAMHFYFSLRVNQNNTLQGAVGDLFDLIPDLEIYLRSQWIRVLLAGSKGPAVFSGDLTKAMMDLFGTVLSLAEKNPQFAEQLIRRRALWMGLNLLKMKTAVQPLPFRIDSDPVVNRAPYVDIATGLNGMYALPGLVEPGREVIFVDPSKEIGIYLSKAIQLFGVQGHVRRLRADALTLASHFKPESIGTIRLRYIGHFVEGITPEWIEGLGKLLVPGGRLIISTYPKKGEPRALDQDAFLATFDGSKNQKMVQDAKQIFSAQKGWRLEYGHIGRDGKLVPGVLGYETEGHDNYFFAEPLFVFTKPNRSRSEAHQQTETVTKKRSETRAVNEEPDFVYPKRSLTLPPRFAADQQVRVALWISDIDQTIAPGDSLLEGENLESLIALLEQEKPVILISGSPYSRIYAGIDFTNASIERRVVEVLYKYFEAKHTLQKMKNLRIRFMSGRGTVTFDENARATITEDESKNIPLKIQVEVAKSLAVAFAANHKKQTLEDFLKDPVAADIFQAASLAEIEIILREKTPFKDVLFWPFESELALIFFDPQAPEGDPVQQGAQQLLARRGIELPKEKYEFTGGHAFAKVSLIRKRDVIEEEIRRINPRGAVLGTGDSKTDNFLTLQGEDIPSEAVYLPVYFGKEGDFPDHPGVIVARDRQGKDGVRLRGFSRIVQNMLVAENEGLSYRDLRIFCGGWFTLRELEAKGVQIDFSRFEKRSEMRTIPVGVTNGTHVMIQAPNPTEVGIKQRYDSPKPQSRISTGFHYETFVLKAADRQKVPGSVSLPVRVVLPGAWKIMTPDLMVVDRLFFVYMRLLQKIAADRDLRDVVLNFGDPIKANDGKERNIVRLFQTGRDGGTLAMFWHAKDEEESNLETGVQGQSILFYRLGKLLLAKLSREEAEQLKDGLGRWTKEREPSTPDGLLKEYVTTTAVQVSDDTVLRPELEWVLRHERAHWALRVKATTADRVTLRKGYVAFLRSANGPKVLEEFFLENKSPYHDRVNEDVERVKTGREKQVKFTDEFWAQLAYPEEVFYESSPLVQVIEDLRRTDPVFEEASVLFERLVRQEGDVKAGEDLRAIVADFGLHQMYPEAGLDAARSEVRLVPPVVGKLANMLEPSRKGAALDATEMIAVYELAQKDLPALVQALKTAAEEQMAQRSIQAGKLYDSIKAHQIKIFQKWTAEPADSPETGISVALMMDEKTNQPFLSRFAQVLKTYAGRRKVELIADPALLNTPELRASAGFYKEHPIDPKSVKGALTVLGSNAQVPLGFDAAAEKAAISMVDFGFRPLSVAYKAGNTPDDVLMQDHLELIFAVTLLHMAELIAERKKEDGPMTAAMLKTQLEAFFGIGGMFQANADGSLSILGAVVQQYLAQSAVGKAA
jgi:broad specificity phosphatase PhoE